MDKLNITEADEGKLFKNRNGDVRKVIYVHPDPNGYTGPVVAICPETGSALNFRTSGQLLRGSTSVFDLVERYEPMTWPEFCKNVLHWATDRGIIANSISRAQVLKGLTEYGELVEAVLNDDRDEVVDAIGDILVCLVNAAGIAGRDLSPSPIHAVPLTSVDYALSATAEVLGRTVLSIDPVDYALAVRQIQELAAALDVDFTECLESAWNAIKDRKGYLNEQGVFVKEVGE